MNLKAEVKEYKYAILNEGMTFGDAYCFESEDEETVEGLVEQAAASYLSEMLWEKYWQVGDQISIEIFEENGPSLGVFNVTYESVPYFTVEKL